MRMVDCFYKWMHTRRTRRIVRSKHRAVTFHRGIIYRRFLRHLKQIVQNGRSTTKRHRVYLQISDIYCRHLLARTFKALKTEIRKLVKSNVLEAEHQMRRMKIQNLVSTLEQRQSTEARGRSGKKMADGRHKSSEVKQVDGRTLRPGIEDSSSLSPRKGAPPIPIVQDSLPSPPAYSSPQRPVSFQRDRESSSSRESSRSSSVGRSPADMRAASRDKPGRTIRTSPMRAGARTGQALPQEKRQTKSTQRNVESAEARRERIKALREAAAARVQTKREREREKERLKELAAEEALKRERDAYRAQQKEQKAMHAATLAKNKENIDAARRQLKRAVAHYRKQLMVRCGMSPWIRLVQERRMDWEKACTFYSDSLLMLAWNNLVAYVRAVRTERYRREHRLGNTAIVHYRRNLMSRLWRRWAMHRKMLRAKAVAVHGQVVCYATRKRAFAAWLISLEKARRSNAISVYRMKKSARLNKLRYCLRRWKTYLEEQEIERVIDDRVDYTWARVQGWLK